MPVLCHKADRCVQNTHNEIKYCNCYVVTHPSCQGYGCRTMTQDNLRPRVTAVVDPVGPVK